MMDDTATAHELPVELGAKLLSVLSGLLLLCSPLTLVEVSPAFFSASVADIDGTQLTDRGLRLIGVIWPVLALASAIYAGIKRSATAISVGLGLLTLTASYGLTLLAAYIDLYGIGLPPEADGVRPTVLGVGVLSVGVFALVIYWIASIVRRHGRPGAVPLTRVLGTIGFVAALVASVASIISLTNRIQDAEFSMWPSFASAMYLVIGGGAMAVGRSAGLWLAAAVAAARLASTLDLVVLRRLSWSLVAESTSDKLVIIGVAVALVCALAALAPSVESLRASAVSTRAKLALPDEWDD